jgi:hypothetical protein
MPLGRIRAIAIIMRQHGPRIMRIGRAGKEVKADIVQHDGHVRFTQSDMK